MAPKVVLGRYYGVYTPNGTGDPENVFRTLEEADALAREFKGAKVWQVFDVRDIQPLDQWDGLKDFVPEGLTDEAASAAARNEDTRKLAEALEESQRKLAEAEAKLAEKEAKEAAKAEAKPADAEKAADAAPAQVNPEEAAAKAPAQVDPEETAAKAPAQAAPPKQTTTMPQRPKDGK